MPEIFTDLNRKFLLAKLIALYWWRKMTKLRRQLNLPQKIAQRKRHVGFSKAFIFLFFFLNFLLIAHSTFKVIGFKKNTYSHANTTTAKTTTISTVTTTTRKAWRTISTENCKCNCSNPVVYRTNTSANTEKKH